jgi:hypothetical protein
MQALIAISVIGPGIPIDADLDLVLADDADITVLHLNVLADENLRHSGFAPSRSNDSVETRV